MTILVNGIPLVHCELKRRGVAVREAFNQINRYARESFWAGSGLFGFVQIFVISNGTHTKYYSNTTRYQHVRERTLRGMGLHAGLGGARRSSNSFEFTSWWADGENRPIEDLYGFARTFMSKHTLLAVLTRYCVWTEERHLMVMRPYQIAATERILQRIVTAVNQKWEGTVRGGGFIWHTTGSGKTLTSFKTATLAARMDGVDKVLFVVDRSDLDYQTIREYDKFQKGAANSNANTAILERQLRDPNARIIITTIQKLGLLCGRGLPKGAESRRTVIIFDECHRSQFGELHQKIVKAFRRYHIFGFTGTPIFAVNAGAGNPFFRTTPQVFGEQLHAYTIVDAIRDGNVLPFHIETVNTVKMKESVKDAEVAAIDTDEVLMHRDRIAAVVRYIREHFDDKTVRNKSYNLKGQRVLGFNSMLAVQSIPMARAYYEEFRRQLAETGAKPLKVATIFTYCANEDDPEDGSLDAGGDPGQLSASDREFLEGAIQDYNAWFGTNYSTDGDRFANYYRDLSEKIKTRQVDLTIVVNMFLTGFDATTLNTLWVDKRLKMHGLIQAFSRTNRILNSVKCFGNIVCFRSSMALRSKKELIQRFIESINAQSGDMAEAWGAFVAQEQEREIAELIEEESLREPETRAFFRKALEDGVLRGAGTDMDLILPPMSRFGAAAAGREEKKRRVFERLSALFDRYRGLGTMG